jgi:hypothetical protein
MTVVWQASDVVKMNLCNYFDEDEDEDEDEDD